MNRQTNPHPASFRDPSGFIYERDGILYRYVDHSYKEHLLRFQTSGLAEQLLKHKWLLPYTEIRENHFNHPEWFTTLQPEYIPFLSYAWEWSFHQLKDAALCTLQICRQALEKGLILKDATHLNIQFVRNKAVLIDHLSFEIYEEGTPWIAYKQFCECFLNPLLLATYSHQEAHRILKSFPEGIPSVTTAPLLPFQTKLNPVVFLHVYLQAKISNRSQQPSSNRKTYVSKKSLLQILDSLIALIQKLKPHEKTTTWNNYYSETILSQRYLNDKKAKLSELLNQISYNSVVDLGANEGAFSLLCKPDALVIAADFDSSCIDRLYLQLKKSKITHIQPIIEDLMQPAPSLGWANHEQRSFLDRCPSDLCLALALIHHLCIGKNVPFEKAATLFAGVCNHLIIEFVPKSDPKVQEMLAGRRDIFHSYTREQFETVFTTYFQIVRTITLTDSDRVLYHLQKKTTSN